MKLSTIASAALIGLSCQLPSQADAVSPSPTSPTAGTLTPRQADQAWQDAAAKFAPERSAILSRVAGHMDDGPFHADWASLETYRSPGWYDNAKFGIFIHWGVYSVPAFGSEWYPRLMYQKGSTEYLHQIATYGALSAFGYKDFIPLFKAQRFDASTWAALFKAAGARYVVPVAEHHDGFAMYDSKLSQWTAAQMGPHKDIIGLLEKAVRAQGLRFGVSSHRAEHDWFFDGGRHVDSDVNDPRYAGLYGPAEDHLSKDDQKLAEDWTYVSQAWLDDWLARTAELIDDYHPDMIYFDWWIGHPTFRNTLPKMLAYYYNQGAKRDGVVVNYKLGDFPEGAGVLDIERGQLAGIQARHWQTDTSVSDKSWGYVDGDTYKSPTVLIHLLADVVSKNGNLMLNIGPRADGTIPDAERDILLAIGGWLKVNGQAIYDTRPWRVFGEGPTEVASGSFQDIKTKPYTADDFRFTTRPGALYAIELGWPDNAESVIHSIKPSDHAGAVTLLADGRTLKTTQCADGLHIHLPGKPSGEGAYVFRIAMPGIDSSNGNP
ncbi:alpha-L-fucosidase [Rhodanobacter sp. K2T2]|uniref:alpha-L-fucosidase n=1 Tax=Rhodanobacter sp. K2T2 TaxID=2723085 RepID=UPI0015CD6CEB|nr:alpha-L-fucosidase [Rhodanobacter sp. K2T2]NYE27818.1 alpha-L-fucosidase [Rhodanobacter sp. K2T2]